MKYWGYLVAKVLVAAGVLYPVWLFIDSSFPHSKTRYQDPVVALHFNFSLLLLSLCASGILWLIVWDQRYRCRTCLRRLRMPIQRGGWQHVLLGAPHTEYICPYGHGTLSVADLQITGRQEPDWAPHEDMWKELFSLEETKK